MTLVDRKTQYETERTQLIEQKNKALKQLEELSIAIERYNGAIAAMEQGIKDITENVPVDAKAEMKLDK